MKALQQATDKFAVTLSLLCSVHCLILPLMMALLPSLAALQLNDERYHMWMLVAVIPSSVFALTMGCKQHKHYRLLVLGFIGLSLLISAVLLGEDVIGEWGEKGMTVLGAGFVAVGHLWNYRLCQHQSDCPCPDAQNT